MFWHFNSDLVLDCASFKKGISPEILELQKERDESLYEPLEVGTLVLRELGLINLAK